MLVAAMRPERPPPPPQDPEQRQREQLATFLAVVLTVAFGGAFVAFLAFITFGLFIWVIVISFAIAAFVGLHYLAWGRPPRHAEPEDEPDDVNPSDDRRDGTE